MQELSGNEPGAVDAYSVITDASLRDYLAISVRRYITKEMSTVGQQTPVAHTTASNRFAIREVKKGDKPIPPGNDFTALTFKSDATLFCHIEVRAYARLPGSQEGRSILCPIP